MDLILNGTFGVLLGRDLIADISAYYLHSI